MRPLPHLEQSPRIHPSVYVDPSARINGDVTIGEEASIWFNTSIRGDVNWIHLGPRSNVQDNCVLHTTYQRYALEIAEEVVIGHGAMLHGCTVRPHCLIGIGSVLLDGCLIEEETLVGAGAIVTPGATFPAGSLVLGCPARAVRALTVEERAALRDEWRKYYEYVLEYRRLGRFHSWDDHPLRDR
ncbi:MAG: gamma carbonic anhydrase family protein [Myxococcota bacterium]|mgnify:CR=1 FL=1|jgi:carbonic anhydrase/acetyltransferase-like protein (isoleucine patch superfamily)|nr:gamma carbonic anhydrase family protein [Myxococcota bacterium]